MRRRSPARTSVAVAGFLLIVAAIGVGIAPKHAKTLEFYSTSAQVIPVTLLVLALEARLFGAMDQPFPDGTVWDRVDWVVDLLIALVVPLIMIAGEIRALSVLASGDAPHANLDIVAAALSVGFAAVVMVPLLRVRKPGE